jgi:hypothetical protein
VSKQESAVQPKLRLEADGELNIDLKGTAKTVSIPKRKAAPLPDGYHWANAVFASLWIPLLGLIYALVVYSKFGNRSKFVAFYALQAIMWHIVKVVSIFVVGIVFLFAIPNYLLYAVSTYSVAALCVLVIPGAILWWFITLVCFIGFDSAKLERGERILVPIIGSLTEDYIEKKFAGQSESVDNEL